MPDVPRYPYQNACAVLDSNILYAREEGEIISPRLRGTLERFKKFPNVEFFIPRIVAREHLFHKRNLLEEGLQRTYDDAQTIAKLTGLAFTPLPSMLTLKWKMYRRFVVWLHESKVKLLRVPIKEINWSKLITASVERLPPFSPYNPDKSEEKGFRDAIILETIVAINIKTKPRTTVFVCNDGLLRDTAVQRIAGLLAFRDVRDYLSRLELELSGYKDGLEEALLDKLQFVFCGQRNHSAVYRFNDIENTIRRKFAERLSVLPDPNPPGTQLPLAIGGFEFVSNDIIDIGTVKVSDIDLSSWEVHASNEVTFKKLYRGRELSIGTFIRVFTANVKWIACIHSGGTDIHSTRLGDIEETSLGYDFARTEDYVAFGLPVPVYEPRDVWKDFLKIDPYGS